MTGKHSSFMAVNLWCWSSSTVGQLWTFELEALALMNWRERKNASVHEAVDLAQDWKSEPLKYSAFSVCDWLCYHLVSFCFCVNPLWCCVCGCVACHQIFFLLQDICTKQTETDLVNFQSQLNGI